VKQIRILIAAATLTVAMATGLESQAATTTQTTNNQIHNKANAAEQTDLLIKFRDVSTLKSFALFSKGAGSNVETLGSTNWVHVKLSSQQLEQVSIEDIRSNPDVLAVQPNYKLHLLENYQLKTPALRAQFAKLLATANVQPTAMPADNPPFPATASGGTGADPDFSKQWGMNDIGLKKGLTKHRGEGVIVAVIDTGVDYTHEDLVDGIWHNKGEMGTDGAGKDKSSNGIDDDANGFIDDVIGWDFVSNDNKPYDLAVSPIEVLQGGGNPGHGTHCAGNVGARGDNGKGVEGIAPDSRIMPLRFLSEKGEGDTAGAIKAIDYAVKMGAKVLSNSWGSEGDDPAEAANNQALKDAITRADQAGVIFIAAAGNGHSGIGYDNDSDAKPGVPASYDMPNIVSVAAIDASNALGSFSNWGARSVDIAAPGVVVYSTTVGSNYSDTVIDMFGIKATWDGTSMAAPHVAGAAALYLSAHPGSTVKQIKDALIQSATPLPNLSGKMVSGGKLNVERLMAQ
jgi:thermitase